MARQVSKNKNFDGIRSAAELLNHMDKQNRERLLTQLEGRDPRITEKIRKEMFLFEDISLLKTKDFQLFLREVPRQKLLLSLRDAPEDFKKSVFESLSGRAATLLQEELENQGPQPLSLVRAAQEDLIKLAKEMMAQGKISLRRD